MWFELRLWLPSALLVGLWILPTSDSAASAPGAVATFENLPALAGDSFPISSRSVGRTFHVNVRLPPGYDPKSAKRYPVVYVLDGDSLFPLLAASHLFIAMDDGLPEAVIVGIAYGSFDPSINRRDVDYLPPSPDKPTAGAAAFSRFLKGELAPIIEQGYAVDPARRILFGQSRGGTFVLFSALEDPDFYWGRIASNPSVSLASEALAGVPGRSARHDLTLLVVKGTSDGITPGTEAQAWVEARHASSDTPWKLDFVVIDGGTHSANAGEAYRRGLRALFGPTRK